MPAAWTPSQTAWDLATKSSAIWLRIASRYSAIASLDGYVGHEQGTFDWAAPDDELLAAVNDLERPIGTYLYGRRMYKTMGFWETASTGADQSAGTSPSSGGSPIRSSTPGRFRR